MSFLYYFQMSDKSLQNQKNFDVYGNLADQHLFSFVKTKTWLSYKKVKVIDF